MAETIGELVVWARTALLKARDFKVIDPASEKEAEALIKETESKFELLKKVESPEVSKALGFIEKSIDALKDLPAGRFERVLRELTTAKEELVDGRIRETVGILTSIIGFLRKDLAEYERVQAEKKAVDAVVEKREKEIADRHEVILKKERNLKKK